VNVINIAHCLYYVDVLDPIFRNPKMLALLNNEAMENAQKEHMTSFHKRLFICDPST
jgi:hypothetical protein